ncbi:MAG: PLP-dependent aminotransferase family protein [Burkholderiaceae bacterium]
MAGKTREGTLIWQRLFRRFDGRESTLQRQLRDALLYAIQEHIIRPGQPIPSSRWLAAALGLSRTTVSIALQQLCDGGTLVPRARSAYVVNPDMQAVQVRAPAARRALVEEPGRGSVDWSRRLQRDPAGMRNIVKPADWQSHPFPFIYGQFDATLFPYAQWRECALETLRKGNVAQWAPDHMDRDPDDLVEAIQRHLLPARGIWAHRENILVTAGAQQATFLIAQLLISPTTTVGIEDPGYPDARNTFAMHTRNLRLLPLDEHGLIVDTGLRGCELLYTTPSHQCPTMVTMPVQRRLALLERAVQDDFVVIEDDHESELNHSGRPSPALKSLDNDGRVIYIGSLSKTLAHGLRLGYLVGPAELVGQLRAMRRLMVRHPPTNNAHTAAVFLRLGHHESYVRRLNRVYRERARTLRQAIAHHLPGARVATAVGGSGLWVRLEGDIDTSELAGRALGSGVVIEAGEVFFGGGNPPANTVRMGFSSIDASRIDAGVKALAAHLNKSRTARSRLEPSVKRTDRSAAKAMGLPGTQKISGSGTAAPKPVSR